MVRTYPVFAACLAAGLAGGAQAATLQQAFESAQAALDSGDHAKALQDFTALYARIAAGAKSRSSNLVRARLASAMVASGKADAALPLLEAAIAGFQGTAAQDAEERALATNDLARAREMRGELSAAAGAYRRVLEAGVFAAGTPGDLRLRVALARTGHWSNPDEARRLLDALLALPPGALGQSGDAMALVKSLRGRVELNTGNPAEAKRWFTAAAANAGGSTTTRVSVTDVRVRGDLALANQRLGRMDDVQKAVAFSGAGSLASEGLTGAADMTLPGCVPFTGLAPDAVAVVEFAIADDGRVVGVTPIFASRGSGPLAGAGPEELFTQAVRRWSWDVASVAKLDPFWRQAVRVELRCFNERPGRRLIEASFDPEQAAWYAARGFRPTPDHPGTHAATLPAIRAEIARREREDGPTSPQLVPALADLAGNAAAPDSDRAAARTRHLELLRQHAAPNATIVMASMGAARSDIEKGRTSKQRARLRRDSLQALLEQQQAAGLDRSREGMLIRLRLGDAHDDLGETLPARTLFDAVVAAPESLLPAADPIRTSALLRLSSLAAAANGTQAAAAAMAATGLAPEQCAVVDTKPQAVNQSIGASTFPGEALRWRTEGFARVGYDITAEGKPVNIRTIVASPPFIFGPATEKAVARFEYRPVFRPGNTFGCSGTSIKVRFKTAR